MSIQVGQRNFQNVKLTTKKKKNHINYRNEFFSLIIYEILGPIFKTKELKIKWIFIKN